jgi:hypothetical protein
MLPRLLSRSPRLRVAFEAWMSLDPRRRVAAPRTALKRRSILTSICDGRILLDSVPDPREPNPIASMMAPSEWAELERNAHA